jgi:hypothetical protein
LTISDVNVAERANATTQARFTVKLSAASSLPVTVDFSTTPGTATAGADYLAANGSLTFLPGETTKSVVISVLDDQLHESAETFFVELSNSHFAAIANPRGQATIRDNDRAPLLAIADATVNAGGVAQFVVRLSAPSGQTVSVQYATSNGSAVAGRDFTGANGTLTFAPGETLKTISVPTTALSAHRAFTISLARPINALFSDRLALASILDETNP